MPATKPTHQPSPLQTAFLAGAAALSLPLPELTALRHLLPPRTVSREALGDVLQRLQLPDSGLADAVFALADMRNVKTIRPADLVATYAILRRSAASNTPESDNAALCLAFLSASAGSSSLSWPQWLAFAGELGLGVGGLDSLPSEDAAAKMHKRWRSARRRTRSLFISNGSALSFGPFLEVMREDDAGLLECLKAIGFVLMHAVVEIAHVPVETPTWDGETDSLYLSQYISFAISTASEKALSSKSNIDTSQVSDHNDKSADAMEDTDLGKEIDSSLTDDPGDSSNQSAISKSTENPGKEDDDITSTASPFPDVARAANANRPATLPRANHRSRHKLGAPRSAAQTDAIKQFRASAKQPAHQVVRRTRGLNGSGSPFHIDFSSLQLGERIGSGAYGDVYHGTFLMTPVAVKMFHVNIANFSQSDGSLQEIENEDPSQMNRMMSMSALQRFASVSSQAKYKNFVREVEMMSVVRHPNLVLYMGACGDPVTPLCIVSELFTGGSLHEYLHTEAEFRPPVHAAVSFALNIAQGMFYLHSSQPSILHRDLKSRNVLLSGRRGVDGVPQVVICDFGLCQLFGEEGQSAHSGGVMGTASYMGPDVINGAKYEAADDVYSYAILLYEIFTGTVPYAGQRAMQVMYRVANEGLRPSGERDEDVPKEIRELLADCWAGDRADRPTFDKIIERLGAIEEALGLGDREA